MLTLFGWVPLKKLIKGWWYHSVINLILLSPPFFSEKDWVCFIWFCRQNSLSLHEKFTEMKDDDGVATLKKELGITLCVCCLRQLTECTRRRRDSLYRDEKWEETHGKKDTPHEEKFFVRCTSSKWERKKVASHTEDFSVLSLKSVVSLLRSLFWGWFVWLSILMMTETLLWKLKNFLRKQ